MPDEPFDGEFDEVENLDDLIEARSDRASSISADIDGMPDADVTGIDIDVDKELSQPHDHKPSEDERLGLNVELMDTPDERDIGFDWQDSAEEMLSTDPSPDEGMGEDEAIEELKELDLVEIVEPSGEGETPVEPGA